MNRKDRAGGAASDETCKGHKAATEAAYLDDEARGARIGLGQALRDAARAGGRCADIRTWIRASPPAAMIAAVTVGVLVGNLVLSDSARIRRGRRRLAAAIRRRRRFKQQQKKAAGAISKLARRGMREAVNLGLAALLASKTDEKTTDTSLPGNPTEERGDQPSRHRATPFTSGGASARHECRGSEAGPETI